MTPLNLKPECPDHACREELMELVNAMDRSHITHKGILAYIGIPIGVISIIIALVMTIVSSNFGALQQNIMVSKQRNDYQDQRLTLTELADANMKGDLAVIREKMANMDKNICVITEAISKIEQRK
jgi:hypothetical protein